MKFSLALALIVAGATAQRVTILEPTSNSTIALGSNFTVELNQAQSLSDIDQISIVIALTPCFGVCGDPSQWGLSTVIYNGPFDPQYHQGYPQNMLGLYQDFNFTMRADWPTGESAISVAHLLNVGASRDPAFDYSDLYVIVV